MSAQKNLSHAYLIASSSEQERENAARDLAQKMLCEDEQQRPCGRCRHCRKVLSGIHPDLIYVEREKDDKGAYKREFQVGRIREMLADAWIRPNEAVHKVYIIRDAQTLNQNAQNAILKMLEEPPGGACFILCTDNAAALLDTVRSRCVELYGTSQAEQTFDGETVSAAESYLSAAASEDLPGLLRLLAAWEKLDTESVRQIILCLNNRLTESVCLRREIKGLQRSRQLHLLRLVSQAETYLRSNVSTKHILGLLSADTIPRQKK